MERNGPRFEFWAKGSGRSWCISLNQSVLFVGLLLQLLVSAPFVRKTRLSLVALHLFFVVFKLFIIIFILFFLLVAVDRGLTRCSRSSLNFVLKCHIKVVIDNVPYFRNGAPMDAQKLLPEAVAHLGSAPEFF